MSYGLASYAAASPMLSALLVVRSNRCGSLALLAIRLRVLSVLIGSCVPDTSLPPVVSVSCVASDERLHASVAGVVVCTALARSVAMAFSASAAYTHFDRIQAPYL